MSSGWTRYFNEIYHESLPDAAFPLDVEDFWCLSQNRLEAAGIQIPASRGKCPSATAAEGDRYDKNNAFSSKDWTWIWHPLISGPYSGFDDNVWVEVDHAAYPDEQPGMWLVYSKGSGVWFNIGKSKIFGTHEEGYQYFGVDSHFPVYGPRIIKDNKALAEKAASQGFQSIQFIKREDGTNYPCAEKAGVPWMNIEIVAVHDIGEYPCGSLNGTSQSFRTGWQGSKACICDTSKQTLNCALTPRNGV